MINKITEFLKKNYPISRTWNTLSDWLQWFIQHEMYSFVVRGDDITAVGLARPVQQAKDGLDHYHFDPLGQCVFIDLAIAKTRESRCSLYRSILQKIGKPNTIAFKRKNKVKEYDFDSFFNKFIRI